MSKPLMADEEIDSNYQEYEDLEDLVEEIESQLATLLKGKG